jgi:hypothetical protein
MFHIQHPSPIRGVGARHVADIPGTLEQNEHAVFLRSTRPRFTPPTSTSEPCAKNCRKHWQRVLFSSSASWLP